MAERVPQEDRTEAATPRRLQKAREEGQVPVSRELAAFAGLAAVTLALVMAAPARDRTIWRVRLSVLLARAHELATGDARLRGWPVRLGCSGARRSCWRR